MRFVLRLLSAFLPLLSISTTINAQQRSQEPQASTVSAVRTVTGTVLDKDNKPVIGAVVMSPSKKGTQTNLDGKFTLNLASGESWVSVECLGYSTKRVSLSSAQNNVRVYLAENAMSLEGTVVVGYGVQKKINLTGAVSTVDTKNLVNRSSADLGHMLQGAVPGMFVSAVSGDPGSDITINIRGFNSINGGKPLVLIDGAEGDLRTVNPADVASISVIKDASSAAIYGARASFGVVLITTKEGHSEDGKPVVQYNGKVGFTAPTTRTDYESTGYWSVYINDLFYRNAYGRNWTNYTEEDMHQLWIRRHDKKENPERPWILTEMRDGRESYIYYCNTDWYHEMFTDINPFNQHNISVNGGNKWAKYYFSAGYEHKEGVYKVIKGNFDKYNLRSRTEFTPAKWLSINNNMSFYMTDYNYPGNGGPSYDFFYSYRDAFASMPLKNPDGTWVYKTIFQSGNITNGCHMEVAQKNRKNRTNTYYFSNTAEVGVHPVEGLDLRTNLTYTTDINKRWHRSVPVEYSKYPGVIETDNQGRFWDRLMEGIDQSKYIAFNLYGTYTHSFNNAHNLTVTAGYNYEAWYQRKHWTEARNLASLYLSDYNLVLPGDDGQYNWNIKGGQSEYALAGFFGRANYDYKGKYLLEISGRYDGTSRFAKGHRWGIFPSASVGWRFSDEPFFASLKNWWNMGKVRFSFGTLGNQQVGYYDFMRTIYKYTPGYMFESETSNASAVGVSNPNASDFTWETTNHFNLGLDLSFFGNRLAFTGEAYIRQTNGMLTSGEPLPGVYGAGSPLKNAANLASYGYEVTVEWKDAFALGSKPFSYNIKVSLSDYITKITKFKNPTKIIGSYYNGARIGDIWGYKTDGLFKTDDEAAAYAKKVDLSEVAAGLNDGWRAGDVKYLDLDGDGILGVGGYTIDSPGDLRVIGNTEPRWQYGINLAASWNGFDASAFFQGIGRINRYPTGNDSSIWQMYYEVPISFIPKHFMDNVWSEDNPDAFYPRPRANLAATGGSYLSTANDRYLMNIGYLRLRNLTVGYTIPQHLTKKIGINTVRWYLSGENIFYWSPLRKVTKYYEPEMMYAKHGDYSFLGRGYPWQRTFVLGLDITF